MTTLPPDQALIHFYRALVTHMDVWRQRMDATTNWASATSAGMITFAFGTEASPHFVLLLALGFQSVFLLMESRRYQIFDLWRRRFRTLNRHLIAPVLRADAELPAESRAALSALSVDLGHLVPRISLARAAGYRIRRNYGYLFLVTLIAWVLRLEILATAGTVHGSIVEQARIGVVPGGLVLVAMALAAIGATVLAFLAPSERMLDWADVPAPLQRIRRSRLD